MVKKKTALHLRGSTLQKGDILINNGKEYIVLRHNSNNFIRKIISYLFPKSKHGANIAQIIPRYKYGIR